MSDHEETSCVSELISSLDRQYKKLTRKSLEELLYNISTVIRIYEQNGVSIIKGSSHLHCCIIAQ